MKAKANVNIQNFLNNINMFSAGAIQVDIADNVMRIGDEQIGTVVDVTTASIDYRTHNTLRLAAVAFAANQAKI